MKKLQGGRGEGERVQRVINTRFKEMSKINLRNEFAIELLARFLSLIFYPGRGRGGEGELFCRMFGVITGNPVAGTPRGMEEHHRRPPPLLIHVSSFRKKSKKLMSPYVWKEESFRSNEFREGQGD